MFTPRKVYHPYASPFDPCKPMRVKVYETPQNIYLQVQPPNLPQFDPMNALKCGTLWPVYYNPYEGRPKIEEESKK
ncbi:spore coat associated protein CotJA [Tumebacillus permanentifrigoris]|uniref:Spore coat protein JA n=1 Tax=Tumebacillus permanentifrigoris TaxID=378543 RepID=A0A316D6T2_9BACL|nr:spore coat associated protein CotJA [Tumebacillus permanentifrigoris]PWK11245.1 spore coat protein JA [Tumebacillus permanentifrigoris]